MRHHQPCPDCSSGHTAIVESRRCSNGTRRRRYGCFHCGHRWTLWDGERPDLAQIAKRRKRRPPRRGVAPLADDQVLQALMRRDLSHGQMGKLLGRSGEAIRQLRHGVSHQGVHPDVPRWGALPKAAITAGRSCSICTHWACGQCGYGFPDPLAEGPGFARECDLYQPA